ncbi:MAG: cysteine rich repeat-containing protein [Hyphomicrobiaceae bacterium]|nr:cysteine rich repeat-containing protein [Hyphomicrobiaceae bacterium]
MKKSVIALTAVVAGSLAILVPSQEPVSAQTQGNKGNIPGMVLQRCDKEIKKFCKGVSPGQGRIAACLYSHSDKLGFDCAYSMYDGAEQLLDIRTALDRLAADTSCKSDIAQYCTGIAPVPDRIFLCLKKNFATLTNGCRKVMPEAETMLKRAGVLPN